MPDPQTTKRPERKTRRRAKTGSGSGGVEARNKQRARLVKDKLYSETVDTEALADAVMGYVRALLKTLPPTDFELKAVKERVAAETAPSKNNQSKVEPKLTNDATTPQNTTVPSAERFDEIEGYRVQINRKGNKGASPTQVPPRKRTSIVSAQFVEPTKAMAVRAVGCKSSTTQLNKRARDRLASQTTRKAIFDKLLSFEEVIRLEQAARKEPIRPSEQPRPTIAPNEGGSLTDVDLSQTEDETEENWLNPRKMKVKPELNLFGRCWIRLARMVTESTKVYLRDPDMSSGDILLEADETELMRKSIFSQKIVQTVNNMRREYGIVTPLSDDIIGLVRTLSLSENTAVWPAVEDWTVAVVYVKTLSKRLPGLAKETEVPELWISMLERADGITVDHLSAFCGLFA
ncbi:hypothetical protein BJ742DRAFT_743541 [Cladochytrium replicatum]|nr:hypothetical protein BJ742DRAFT_743541 [Cladochytrium replicatum]